MKKSDWYIRIEEYKNRLYKNEAKAFIELPDFVRMLQNFIAQNDNLNIDWNEFVERISYNYNAQSVIGAADTISELVLNQHIEYYEAENIDINYLEKNKKCSSCLDKTIYECFNNIDEKVLSDNDNIILDSTGNIAVYTASGIVYLNSLLHNREAEKVWSREIINAEYYNLVIIYGLSNKEYIKQIIRDIDKDVHILVYEPDVNIFYYNYIYTDMCGLLENDNLYLIVEGLNTDYLKTVIDENITYINIDKLLTYCSPGYDVLYSNMIKKFEELCKRYLINIQINNNSLILWNEIATKNIMYNMEYMIGGTDIFRLKKKMQCVDKSNIPAIIVAAGPSLDKNINVLKSAVGKAFILGVDSSIRLMLKNKILPDAIVTLDPNKPRVLFENDIINDIPFFYTCYSTHDVLCNNRYYRILYNEMGYIYDKLNKMGKKSDIINFGGSVACAACAIAAYLGFKNIIVIGQDLAFTNNKKHASIVYDEKPVSESEKDMYTTIEGWNGEELLTFINFKHYRDWYEDFILQHPDINFINATEGGALIHGALHIKLVEAIDKYCNGKFKFKNYLNDIELLFKQNEKSEVINILKKSKNYCDELHKIFSECIKLYNLSIDSSEEEKNIYIDDINKLLSEMNGYSEMELLESYVRQTQNIELSNLYDDYKDAWETAAKKGIIICNSYISAIESVKELLDEGIKNIEEKYTDI